MIVASESLLSGWQNFYVIIGGAAAALTGLMFVVVTLIAGRGESRSGEAIGAFGTPNVVHFCAALLTAAILCAPWPVFWYASVPLGLAGLGGIVYVIIITRRALRQTSYQPVLEDWLWHMIFPFIAYLALLVSAIVLATDTTQALFAIGAAAVLLLFIGIHNAWDTVTYLTTVEFQSQDRNKE